MSKLLATVLVPTHEHGPLLRFAVRSALDQTVESIEVFIVCDGADAATLEAAEGLAGADPRVRLFVNEKGPRHGEVHRHRALAEASGQIVCYLSDDDLWLPNHIATMARLLEAADFADAHAVDIRPDGRLEMWPAHLTLPEVRRSMFEGYNFIPISAAAHTLELYRRLPHGWRTAPDDVYTDLYMWQQILSVEDLRVMSGEDPTVLHFASLHRGETTMRQRITEMERWSEAMRAPDFASNLNRQVLTNYRIAWATSHRQARELQGDLRDARDRLADLRGELAAAEDRIRRADADREGRIARLESQVAQLQSQLDWMTNSRTWRIREALLRPRGVAWLLRKVGVARSR